MPSKSGSRVKRKWPATKAVVSKASTVTRRPSTRAQKAMLEKHTALGEEDQRPASNSARVTLPPAAPLQTSARSTRRGAQPLVTVPDEGMITHSLLLITNHSNR